MVICNTELVHLIPDVGEDLGMAMKYIRFLGKNTNSNKFLGNFRILVVFDFKGGIVEILGGVANLCKVPNFEMIQKFSRKEYDTLLS